jgi:endonuclease YncB( thermonuclease family)
MNLLDNSVFDLPLYSVNNIKCLGRIVDVYDGDTITIVFQLGNQLQKHKIRLYGINSPEFKGIEHNEGLSSRNFLLSQILNKELVLDKEYKKIEIVTMLKDCKKLFTFELLGEEKYGRILAKVYYDNECLNDLMLLHGYAKEYLL